MADGRSTDPLTDDHVPFSMEMTSHDWVCATCGESYTGWPHESCTEEQYRPLRVEYRVDGYLVEKRTFDAALERLTRATAVRDGEG